MKKIVRLRMRLELACAGQRLLREREAVLHGRLSALFSELRENRRRLKILERKCIPDLVERIREIPMERDGRK